MNFNGRDGVILVIALVVAYLLVTTLRLYLVGRAKKEKAARDSGRLRVFLHSLKAWLSPGPAARRPPRISAKPPMPPERRDPSLTPSFDDHLFRHNVETELQQLRAEVAGLRETLGRLQTSRSVSPQYTEAMRLAQRGASAQIIADECAISIGEAELVRALSRNSQEHPDDDGQYDEDTWEK